MVNQGFLGALEQFWTVEEKPRLDRRNSWFRDHKVTETHLRVFLFLSVFLILSYVTGSLVMGVFL